MKQLNWAILGAGGIANELATAATRMGKTIYGVANRTHETAVKFAEKYGVTKVYDNIEDLFEDPNVDILYLSTPHNTHYEFIKKALLAGKHVLAEKSITLNSTQLEEVIALASGQGAESGAGRGYDHLAYAPLQEAVADDRRWRTGQGADDHHELRLYEAL